MHTFHHSKKKEVHKRTRKTHSYKPRLIFGCSPSRRPTTLKLKKALRSKPFPILIDGLLGK
jgi:hypothetical protein